MVYIDDFLVYSETIKEHTDHLKRAFDVIRKHNLKIKIKKCKFFQTSIDFLGHVVSNDEIKPPEEKIEAIKLCKLPENVEQILAFIGMASHYGKFIKDFA